MVRILVVGASGSGKTTLARRLAAEMAVPHIELDALQHGPGWTPRPTFVADVTAAVAAPAWVVDGNYSAVQELVWARADTVVWLDLPRWLVEWRVVRRTAGRLVLRRRLWNGNRERWRDVPRADHPIRWSWRKHAEYRVRYAERFATEPAERACVRLRGRAEVAAWSAVEDGVGVEVLGGGHAAP
ncbi:putative adenylate kinase [Frankia canadensis]|uniref:Putative adenylate kinase n=1 Tax=Frankia canadensis TaxID=1836972 RepID=A0A2I2KWT5_9ACTN|nr:AAA family ATPase [Frankia canadensis]SNQ50112.1 putative adenylate kinase [Frankia canadensis]SOU57402.1 putative adenylate kinase [Frankia canadensis]